MNIVQKALAYGTPGVIALTGGFLYVQHEIHYWLTPAHMANAGLAAGAGGVIVCSLLGAKAAKALGRKGSIDDSVRELAAELRAKRDALPEGQPHTVTYQGHSDHVTHRDR